MTKPEAKGLAKPCAPSSGPSDVLCICPDRSVSAKNRPRRKGSHLTVRKTRMAALSVWSLGRRGASRPGASQNARSLHQAKARRALGPCPAPFQTFAIQRDQNNLLERSVKGHAAPFIHEQRRRGKIRRSPASDAYPARRNDYENDSGGWWEVSRHLPSYASDPARCETLDSSFTPSAPSHDTSGALHYISWSSFGCQQLTGRLTYSGTSHGRRTR